MFSSLPLSLSLCIPTVSLAVSLTVSPSPSLSQATFCLAPSGLGWGIRTVISLFYGCIPVIIQDDVAMPYEDFLPWDEFSIR